jgi:DNA mismatch repair protein MutS2
MDSGSIAFESVIEQAEAGRRDAEAAKTAAERTLQEIESGREALEREMREFEEKKAALWEKTKDETLEKLSEADEYADIVRTELKALLDEAGDFIDSAKADAVSAEEAKEAPSRGDYYRRLDETRKSLKRLEGEFQNLGGKTRGGGRRRVAGKFGSGGAAGEGSAKYGGRIPASDVRAGVRVKYAPMDAEGEVLTPPDDKGDVQIQVGRIKMTVPIGDLRAVKQESSRQGARPGARRGAGSGGHSGRKSGALGGGYTRIMLNKANSVRSSIDVHGQTLDDAIISVDKYIDDAVLAGYGEVQIIHGRGEGILRAGLRKMLQNHKQVKKTRTGAPDEGGDGTTVVTLKP